MDETDKNRHRYYDRGLWVRVSPIDLSVQILVPEKLPSALPKNVWSPGWDSNYCDSAEGILLAVNGVRLPLDSKKLHILQQRENKFAKTQVLFENFHGDYPAGVRSTDVLGTIRKR